MTQEEKQLLLKDLCARLPYGVKIKFLPDDRLDGIVLPYLHNGLTVLQKGAISYRAHIKDIKPYLRPMSSMTEGEREDWYRQSRVDYDCEFKPEPTLSLEHCYLSVDWLNKYGFDYRGLIPMGLALEAPEDMYKTE